MNIIEGLFQENKTEFASFLENEDNIRIVFSGVYGIGKTTFLKYFFDSQNQKRFNIIHLYPVNYSILSNEDILTYIKYDILYELLITQEISFATEKLNFLETAPSFIKTNLIKVLATFILTIPKMGKQLFQLYERLEGLGTEFQKFQDKIAGDKLSPLDEYIREIHEKEGGIYEYNVITQIIENSLLQLAEASDKQNVLIIDDLDRIDPKHVFRLFNVFAAHFDQRDNDRAIKFGFDKIIFVCDIRNIRGIFRSQYGVSVDFNGYIDKFFSQKIFYFNNFQAIEAIVDNIFSPINLQYLINESHARMAKSFLDAKTSFILIIRALVQAGAINLRTLLKFRNRNLDINPKKIVFDYKTTLFNWQLYPVLMIDILFEHFGSFDYMIERLESAASFYHDSRYIPEEYNILIGTMLAIIRLSA